LGSLTKPEEAEGKSDLALSRKVQKLRSKGWSQSKINRWLAQRDQNEEKRKREAADQAKHHTLDADRWLSILNELIQSGTTPSVGLLIHWYTRGLDSERIDIHKRIRVRIRDASSELMLKMEHDVLYEFTK
jgi:transcriptional regulator